MNRNSWTAPASLGVTCAVASLAFALSPAAAEPYPWHNPDAVATSAPAPLTKAQVEYRERRAAEAAIPTKAQVEHRERVAAEEFRLTKAQVEYLERGAAAADSAKVTADSGRAAPAQGIPWAVVGFAALGVAAVGIGALAMQGTSAPRPTH